MTPRTCSLFLRQWGHSYLIKNSNTFQYVIENFNIYKSTLVTECMYSWIPVRFVSLTYVRVIAEMAPIIISAVVQEFMDSVTNVDS